MDCGGGELPVPCSTLQGCRNARALLFWSPNWETSFFPSFYFLGSALLFAVHVPQLTQLEVRPKTIYQAGEEALLTLWYPQLIDLNKIPPTLYLPFDVSVLRPEASF